MSEKIDSAKAALKYIEKISSDKKTEIRAIDTKLFAMIMISGILLLFELFLASVLFQLGKLFAVLVLTAIVLAAVSIVILIIAFWDNRKEDFSSKLDKNLFENNDLIIFYREVINNMKINFAILDRTLKKKKSLLFASSICLFAVIADIIVCTIIFVIKMM